MQIVFKLLLCQPHPLEPNEADCCINFITRTQGGCLAGRPQGLGGPDDPLNVGHTHWNPGRVFGGCLAGRPPLTLIKN